MKTSEHIRLIADELASVIEYNRMPGTARDIWPTIESIANRLVAPNAALLLYKLRRDAKLYYSTGAPRAETSEAEALYGDLLASITRLRMEASSRERIGD